MQYILQVGINNNCLSGSRDIRCPFVGHKRSGYGSHSGQDGWRQFSVPKSLLYREAPPAASLPMAPPAPSPSEVGAPLLLGIALASAAAGAAIAALAARYHTN